MVLVVRDDVGPEVLVESTLKTRQSR